MKIEITKGEDNPVADFFSSTSDTPETENLKCLSLIEVMEIPRERRTIALGLLQAIKERDKALEQRNCLHDLHNKNAIRSQELLDLCETLRKERDEADSSLEKEKIALNYIIKRAIETERERDEAYKIAIQAIDSLRIINASDWKTSGELRSIARITLQHLTTQTQTQKPQ